MSMRDDGIAQPVIKRMKNAAYYSLLDHFSTMVQPLLCCVPSYIE